MRAAAKMKNRQLAASYEGWLDYIDKRLRFKYLAFKIFRRLEHSIALKGMNKWKFVIYAMKKYENDIKGYGNVAK